MSQRVTPMIHVTDVAASIAWYTAAGFSLVRTVVEPGGDEPNWALLAFGATQLMLNGGGRPSAERRREVDLYVHVDDVAAVAERLKGRVTVVEDLHDTFYGMRELIVRDRDGFWVTFGQPSVEPPPHAR